MDWTVIGVLTDIAGTLAVIATLIYLAIQVRTGNKQAELEGLRHTLDGFNQYCDLVVSSRETAALLNRGREGLEGLDEIERTQFEHLHIRFLNTVEGWYRQVMLTARDGRYRTGQLENIALAAQVWLGNPGGGAVWQQYRLAFPLVTDFIDEALAKAEASAHAG